MSDRVGIFGGSFDPVHNGHIAVIHSLLKSNLFDFVRVLLTPHPPHKRDIKQASYEHRFAMLELAVSDIQNVMVSKLETRLPQPSYSLQTIDYLQRTEPENLFFLCLGEDSIVSFRNWYKYEEILKKTTLVIAERPGFDKKMVDAEILEKSIFVEHNPVDISSTGIRNRNRSDFQNEVPPNVAEYIQQHNLYE
ncbi:MAG: nicotinate (nicotinamide) nucleotide adenylyltransferase [Balneolaceae bacterium]